MNSRTGGVGIIGVIVIVLVILFLVGVIKLWSPAPSSVSWPSSRWPSAPGRLP